ncbi:DUF1731 domain-containing protein [Nigerium massiliense]|uniref:DUF1731 domain-containing protein n=1 Tax=Nigerium massiliense TaxID=1522317 RepID=UPI000590E39E|nr:DUF1731 domain-containing protein [Nigerium massiliense]
MRIAIAGGTGSLGTLLEASLADAGHGVVKLQRGEPTGPNERRWDPETGHIFGPGLDDVDAVINLAGESIGQRWTPEVRRLIRASRLTSTLTVVAALDPNGRCQRFLNASSCAIYGDRGDEVTDVDAPSGQGFLARTCVQWETSARHSPVPTVLLRSAHVLSAGDGARGSGLASTIGLGLRVGRRDQFVPWIHARDWVAAVRHLVTSDVEGPVNVTAPDPVRYGVFLRSLRRASRRPSFSLVSARARFGAQMVDEVLRPSIRAVPGDLLASGFTFRFPGTDAAMTDLFAGSSVGQR